MFVFGIYNNDKEKFMFNDDCPKIISEFCNNSYCNLSVEKLNELYNELIKQFEILKEDHEFMQFMYQVEDCINYNVELSIS